ncbi:MAG TPA: hypothetical protein VJA21_25795 [Verrucomicrobiae bacterium]
MNMNSEQDDFQQLRRLLVLKRYEQPPPGYFHTFSQRVILRIRSAEPAPESSIFALLSWDAPWLQRLLGSLQTRPAVAGGFGFAVCGLLLAGLLFSESPNRASELSGSPLAFTASIPPTGLQAGPATDAVFQRVSAPSGLSTGMTSPAQPGNSLFQQLKDIQGPHRAQLLESVVPPELGQ